MMMLRLVVMIQLLFLFGALHMQLVYSGAGQKNGTRCLDNEHRILLDLKDGFQNKSGHLASWNGTDCCRWQGIYCDKLTGHVISLNLSLFNNDNQYIYNHAAASLKPSLVGLKYLKFLDLSGNNFAQSAFPQFLGSFQQLEYLNLFDCNFSGTIPQRFGNLSSLHYLDLSLNDIHDSSGSWLHKLSSLRSIRTLKLFSCGLSSPPQTVSNSTFQFLTFLDLSFNNFNTAFPQWLLKLSRLEHLDLSFNELHEISSDLSFSPPEHLNFSFPFLSYLDLSCNNLNTTIPGWLYRITSLQHLDLSLCSLQGSISHEIGALSSLQFVAFEENNLQGLIPVEIGNLSNLLTLALSGTSLDIAINSKGMGGLCNLRELYLCDMQTQPGIDMKRLGIFWSQCTANSLELLNLRNSTFYGNLPDWLWGLENLNALYLDTNSISGSIPTGIGKLSSLQILQIFDNLLNGSIDKAIGNLSKLYTLDLHGNNMKGVLTESHFSQLVCLKYLDVSGNSIVLNVGSKWIPPFRLEYIDMSGCSLGPFFPPWLQGQKTLQYLDMSNTLLGDSLPNWFWSTLNQLVWVDLSNNNIHGSMIPSPVRTMKASLTRDNSSSNSYQGANKKVPSSQITYLDLSNNSFSGPFPYSLCDLAYLSYLDLSKNNLAGDIPNCWSKTPSLSVINFGDNYLSGGFPCSLCFSTFVFSIQLNNNLLSGKVPHCLKKCTKLELLDIGNNRLIGHIPRWLGESNLDLNILSLRSNSLFGQIPPELSFLNKLQILDLSGNNLSGEIPLSLGNLRGMVVNVNPINLQEFIYQNNYSDPFYFHSINYVTLDLALKGFNAYYKINDIQYFASIDLSCNKLSGKIPIELTDLFALAYLNLSNNHLGGEIPSKIGNLMKLESLDLSRNQLDGPIPDSLSNLSLMSHLNLSYNLLSGKIPTGPQLQTLIDPSIYEGNLNLCGPPLNISCEPPSVMPSRPDYTDSNESGRDSIWDLGSMGFGFAAGLLGFSGFILYQSKWNDAYLHFVDMLLYKIFFKWII